MDRANEEIIMKAKYAGIAQWQIASELGVCENTIQRKLRQPLSKENQQIFMNAINSIIEKRGL